MLRFLLTKFLKFSEAKTREIVFADAQYASVNNKLHRVFALELEFPFFPDFQLPEKQTFFKKIFGNPRRLGKFPGNFTEFDYFAFFFWFSAFQISFLAFRDVF